MKQEKLKLVEDLHKKISQSPFLIIVEYTGMTVSHFVELRQRLSEVKAELHVFKNTFLKIAAEPEFNLSSFKRVFEGQNALVTGQQDISAAAKVLKTFAAEFEKPVMKLGVLDKIVLKADELKAIADLPSKDVLRTILLGLFLAPATQFVRVLNEPAASLARVLKAKSEIAQ